MQIKLRKSLAAMALSMFFVAIPCVAVDINSYPALKSLVGELTVDEEIEEQKLIMWLTDATINKDLVGIMERPAESLPWYRYKDRFLNKKIVKDGKKYQTRYRAILDKAQIQFGIPPEIVVAIIGVETRYGRNTGRHRVLDSLVTLALKYDRRSNYFLNELKEYMWLSARGIFNPLKVKGSYAGAFGIAQFMPSSYRNYAIDFDHNAQSNLLESHVDAIGSVANYLSQHGWQAGAPILGRLSDDGKALSMIGETRGYQPDIAVQELEDRGIVLYDGWVGDKIGIIKLKHDDREEFVIAYPNYFVLTRYNRSQNYAMVVSELAENIDN
ncbi:MAG: lytic murein transglycosylase B [Acidiferrobacteraceae bacterium]|nr:lytic murein transglycosylase B [Acidiferrobacteraceae bacterium]|tara:strand:+ start:4475 stop:5455 length:981 start_codon:yes stop_codon:yes gene_type:complete